MKDLKKYLKEFSYWKSIQALHNWDMETYMPEGAINDRAERLSFIDGKIHEHMTCKKYQKLLKSFQQAKKTKLESKLAKELLWDFKLKSKLPSSHVQEMSKATTHAIHVWATSKKNNDWKSFYPHLNKVINLKKKEADFYKLGNRYDGLLLSYEKELTSQEIGIIFDELKVGLKDLVKKISPSERDNWEGEFPISNQVKLNHEMMSLFGLPSANSRLDSSGHPFSTIISPLDHRITTRYEVTNLNSLYATMHEVGHSLYGLNLPTKWEGSPFQEAISLSVDESQSRFWENIIGRSRPFCRFILPKIKNYFPKTNFSKMQSDELFLFLNDVNPSLIRVDSCELYYNIHIIIRFEIEKMIFNENLKTKEIPDVWNEKYRDYLGMVPPSNSLGVLQDTHWAAGAFGYFPTYTLGNLLSATLMKKLSQEIPNWENLVEEGNFSPILSFLNKNVHRHGRMIDLKDLAPKLGAKDYLDYLKSKLISN
ncbi:MAG: carboxypeptidase M32 [Bacteriovoracaceae bacterium]|nr:carboxypeptidase M32 [Bacteriovoracaceae bacterium]